MIEQLAESEGASIGLKISGKIDMQQELHWIGVFDALINDHGTINVLVLIDGKFSADLDVAYTDFKWMFTHLKNMNNMAIVSNSKVLSCLVAVDSPFAKLIGISEKHFETNKLADAWSWLKA